MKLLCCIFISTFLLAFGNKSYSQAIDTVCYYAQQKVYRVVPTPGSTYYWTVECGTIISNNLHADSVVVSWCQNPGIYQLSVVEKTKAGCWGDTVKTWVQVEGKRNMVISGPKESCAGDPIWLTLEAGGQVHYLWSTGETDSAILVRPVQTTMYSVIGYSRCSRDTGFITIQVHPKPKADFSFKPKNPIVDENVFFHYLGTGATDWTWYFGDKNDITGTVTDPEFTFNEKGDKTVTLVVRNEFGCTDTMSYKVHVTFDSKIFIPNAFTPNSDGNNDGFKAIGFNLEKIHTQIYNRWGELIWEGFNVNDSWDGTFKGARVMEGVYIYQIDAQDKEKEHYYLSGNITVLY